MTTSLSDRIHRQFAKPTRIDSPWAPDDLVQTILSQPTRALGHAAFSVVLLGSFEQSLWFLPYALEFMERQQDDYYEITSEVFGFVICYREQLIDANLWNDVIEKLHDIFFKWMGEFNLSRASHCAAPLPREWVYEVDNFARDTFLDDLMRIAESNHVSAVFSALIDEWSLDFQNEYHSAHLLDLCFEVRVAHVIPRELYTSEIVSAIADNERLLCRHWRNAEVVMRRVCSTHYIDMLVNELMPSLRK